MNAALVKAMIALVPACTLLLGSAVLFFRARNGSAVFQLLGAGFLVVVVVTHIFEALNLFAWMHWGHEYSVGHYVDLVSAVLGLTLFPVGYLLHAVNTRHT